MHNGTWKQHTGLATGAIALGEVTTLDHELLDDTVEGRALITEALLASGKSAEVFSGLGDGLAIETHNDAAEGLVALLNVEVDLVGDLGALGCLGGLRKEQHRAEEQRGGEEESPQAEHLDCSQ